MKAKTIKAVLRGKIDDWLSTIEDEDLRAAMRDDIMVTGGCIASMLLREQVNDYDVYFRTRATTLRVAQYYVDRFKKERNPKGANGIEVPIFVDATETRKESGIKPGATPDRIRIVVKSAGIASKEGSDKDYEYFEMSPDERAEGYVADIMSIQDPGTIADEYEELSEAAEQVEDAPGEPRYRPIFLSTNAITLSNKIQIVIRFYGEADEIHENYDFVHCTNYWYSRGNELVLRQPALEALLAKELMYVGSKYPICSVIRLRKFIKRNWTINAGQILKMCMQISQLDLTNPDVLEDQLTGVDTAYFVQLISKLKEKDPEKVDYAYLIEIIDRMF